MAVQPEVIGDVDRGAAPPPGGIDDLGLTAEERAQWDSMRNGAEVVPDSDAPQEPEVAPETPEEGLQPDGPKPEVAGEDGEDDDGPAVAAEAPKNGKGPQKQVNFQKHQREIGKRDKELAALQQRLQTESEQRIKLSERLAILNEALTAPAPADPAKAQAEAVAANPMLEPDIKVEDDALGAIAQLQRRNAYLMRQQDERHETTQATLEDRQMVDDFARDAAAYSRTEAGQHFAEAYQFLKDSRLTELAISLFDKDPTDPNQQFTQAEISRLVADFNAEEKWVVQNARSAGKSPAAAIMKLARGRQWKPPEAAPQPAPASRVALPEPGAVPTKPGNGTAPPAKNGAAPDAVAKLKAETEAAAASRSLSDGGGAPPGQPLTPERLLAMNDDEFAQYVDQMPKHQLDSILGKPAQR